jgi:molybdopterin-guanine dinucleotide biosynthesis protein A
MTPTIGILIGGDSRRMGRPKALIRIDGTTLIERTAALAAEVSEDVVLLGTPPFDLPTALKAVPVIPDRHPGRGPMAGLESLLTARPHRPSMLLACDMPRLSSALLERLCEVPADCDAVVACTPGEAEPRHPCCAVYRPAILPAVREAIAARQYGMIRLLARLRIWPIELAGEEARAVENWNDPADAAAQDRPAQAS